jgi:SAM-dependent methyltransferase
MIDTDVTQQIPREAVRFHPLSRGDPHGRIFEWEENLYRGIPSSSAPLYRRLFAEGTVQRLVDSGALIQTEPTPFSLEGFELVLRHRRVPFVSYAYEWSGSMLKDAALRVLDLNLALAEHGLATQDAHPANILFDGCRPVFVDLGSIIAIEPQAPWPAYDEFCRFYLYPLYLMAHGHGRIARWLLHDTEQGVLGSDFFNGLGSVVPSHRSAGRVLAYHVRERLKRWYPQLAARVPPRLRQPLKRTLASVKESAWNAQRAVSSRLPRVAMLQKLRAEIEAIRLPALKSAWVDYYQGSFPPFTPDPSWGAKRQAVWSVLDRIRPQSVLDIGSNQGWYAELALRVGSQVVACDTDEASIAALYERGRAHHLPLLPLLLDVRYPSPGSGLANESFAPATQRLRCDVVLALALVHHLVFKQNVILFDRLLRGLEVFSKEWLLIEFVSKDDPYVAHDWSSERHGWYSMDGFLNVLALFFKEIERLPSDSPSRTLFLCRK